MTADIPLHWKNTLQEAGYRLTRPREVILRRLAASDRAVEPLELYDLCRREYPSIGIVTVYRTLEKLESLDLIQRVHHAGGCRLYLRSESGHVHLLFCTACHRAEFFSGDDLDPLIDNLQRKSGYRVESHWLQLNGICSDCRGRAAHAH